eukprot:5649517-Pleurochrysis_carterae.AAC.3
MKRLFRPVCQPLHRSLPCHPSLSILLAQVCCAALAALRSAKIVRATSASRVLASAMEPLADAPSVPGAPEPAAATSEAEVVVRALRDELDASRRSAERANADVISASEHLRHIEIMPEGQTLCSILVFADPTGRAKECTRALQDRAAPSVDVCVRHACANANG